MANLKAVVDFSDHDVSQAVRSVGNDQLRLLTVLLPHRVLNADVSRYLMDKAFFSTCDCSVLAPDSDDASETYCDLCLAPWHPSDPRLVVIAATASVDTEVDAAVLRAYARDTLEGVSKISPKLLPYLRDFSALRTLSLCSHDTAVDDDLAAVGTITSLTSLDFSYCAQLTGALFKHLPPRLRVLCATDLPLLRDSSLPQLTSVTSLTELRLSKCTSITDAGVAHLSSLPLTTLFLSGCVQLGDDAVRHVSRIKTLERLMLCSMAVTDDGLRLLASLTSLAFLSVSRCVAISGSGFDVAASWPRLRELHCGDTPLSESAYRYLADGTPSLANLVVPRCSIDAAALGHIARLPKLAFLNISDNGDVDGAALARLSSAKHLTTLSAGGCSLTRDDVVDFAKATPSLRQLSLRRGAFDRKDLQRAVGKTPKISIR